MLLSNSLLALFLLIPTQGVFSTPAPRTYTTHDYYVLEHDPSSALSLDDCALALGVSVVEQVGNLRDHWLVRTEKPPDGILRRSDHPERDDVLDRYTTLQRRAKQRSVPLATRSADYLQARRLTRSIRSLQRQHLRQRTKRQLIHVGRASRQIRPQENVTSVEDVARYLQIDDPEFPKQWHLVNGPDPDKTINVTAVWDMGYTGKGVRVAVIDDGLDFMSDDLADNYSPEGSWDFNDHVPDPLPRLSDDQHGTRCSGEIAAVKNDVCGVGVAYGADISGIRILSGPISDADEAASLNYGYQDTSIYSCSWGPPDDGRSMEAPNDLIQKAVLNGIHNGRGGKGSIFVFASGNGNSWNDQCNFDGYTNSIFSITVAAIDMHSGHPYYSEACAANMVVAYSSGSGDGIHTTDTGKRRCTSTHGGTSAAAPLMAGVVALALEARPDLTWRDVQHLAVYHAFQVNPNDPDWEITAAGLPYSYKYGYGAIDGYAYVKAALTWQLVKPQAWIDVGEVDEPNADMDWTGAMSGGIPIIAGGVRSQMAVTEEMLASNNFETMEHITIRVWIDHARRGDVEVDLVSPNGIKSVLAGKRPRDDDKDGFRGWQFSTVKHWAENPIGNWTIHVSDQQNANNGSFLGWSMTLWGSVIDPLKAKQWQLPGPSPNEEDDGDDASTSGLPTSTSDDGASTSRTKVYAKPTDHLPSNHTEETGETHLPAFTSKPLETGAVERPTQVTDEDLAASGLPSPSSSPIPSSLDGGYFDNMRDLLSSQTWLFGALGMVMLFMLGAGVYYWRRRMGRRRRSYTTVVNSEDVPMGALERGGRMGTNGDVSHTKELYDPFAHASSDDEDEADEHVALTSGHERPVGLAYHDGFLDDEDQTPARPQPLYRDEPDEAVAAREVDVHEEVVEDAEDRGEERIVDTVDR